MKDNYRLGNYVSLLNKTVSLSESDMKYILDYPLNYYNPITLTKEWIEKLNFKRMDIQSENENYFLSVNEYQQIRIVKNQEEIIAFYLDTVDGFEEGKCQLITRDKKFFEVHTLQNFIKDHENPNYPYK